MNPDLSKIAVVGTSCAGKTTLAAKLAQRLNLRHIELDALFWEPNWEPTPDHMFYTRVEEAVKGDRWITDGNYSPVRKLVWGKASTLIWLNYAFPVVFLRALNRTIIRISSGQEIFSNNKETFRKAFLSRESLLLWIIQTHWERKKRFPKLFKLQQYAHLNVIELNNQKETDALVSGLADEPLEPRLHRRKRPG